MNSGRELLDTSDRYSIRIFFFFNFVCKSLIAFNVELCAVSKGLGGQTRLVACPPGLGSHGPLSAVMVVGSNTTHNHHFGM